MPATSETSTLFQQLHLNRRHALLASVATLASAALPAWANAAYPNRAVKIVAPFSPGQGVDLLARAQALREKFRTTEIHAGLGEQAATGRAAGGVSLPSSYKPQGSQGLIARVNSL